MSNRSGHCGHSVGIPLVATNEGDLNEDNRAHPSNGLRSRRWLVALRVLLVGLVVAIAIVPGSIARPRSKNDNSTDIFHGAIYGLASIGCATCMSEV
jgi:hypothetical protein